MYPNIILHIDANIWVLSKRLRDVSMVKKILAIVSAVLIFSGLLGELIIWAKQISFLKEYTNIYQMTCPKDSKKKCPDSVKKDYYKTEIFYGAAVTICFLLVLFWVSWSLWTNFNLDDYIGLLLYCGVDGLSLLFLIANILIMGYFKTVSLVSNGDLIGLFITYYVGFLIFVGLSYQSYLGDDNQADENV